jgi:hypothetical protein
VRADDLLGAWRLVAYCDLDDEGNATTGPLGHDPRGLLIYLADGHMSVSMMRADAQTAVTSSSGPGQTETFMGYAGSWELTGGQVVHRVEVSAHPHIVGTEQVRDFQLLGDRLTLQGTALINERPQRRELRWRRVGPAEPVSN